MSTSPPNGVPTVTPNRTAEFAVYRSWQQETCKRAVLPPRDTMLAENDLDDAPVMVDQITLCFTRMVGGRGWRPSYVSVNCHTLGAQPDYRGMRFFYDDRHRGSTVLGTRMPEWLRELVAQHQPPEREGALRTWLGMS